MKNMVTLAIVAISLTTFAIAENIDGTLAVDGGNKLTTVQPTKPKAKINSYSQKAQNSLSVSNTYGNSMSDSTLDAGIDDNSAKDAIPASTLPTGTLGSYTEGPFVGIELNGILASEAEGKSTSGMSFGLRFGAQNIDWRTMAILERYPNTDEGNSYYRGLLQLDYFFWGQDRLMLDTYGVRPYAGVNAGLISLDTDDRNIKSLTYGGQAGATMSVTNNIDLDVSYKYNLTSSDAIDHTSGISVGLNYKY